ncbi:hypothetical protein PENSPDRAFT_736053 [Peniophora sp. CONT]|nr:hypothetical protein PENSPDRAFT_736053 [Peniophora sp. CONT]
MSAFSTPLSPLSLPSPSGTLVSSFRSSNSWGGSPHFGQKFNNYRGHAKRAGPPWDDSDADLVLRSAEDVEFRVHRIILARSLSAFDLSSLFARSGDQELSEDGLPILRLPDGAETVATLLSALYPGPAPVLTNLSSIRAMLGSLDRYGARFVPASIRSALEALASAEPEQTYVLACAARLPDIARTAARATLRAPRQLAPVSRSDLLGLTALQYHALVLYQDECRAASRELASSFAWIAGDDVPGAVPADPSRSALECGCAAAHEQTASRKGTHAVPYYLVPEWVRKFMASVAEALVKDVRGEIARRPAMMIPALKEAFACNDCANAVEVTFTAFAEKLEQQINQRISEVQLEVDA